MTHVPARVPLADLLKRTGGMPLRMPVIRLDESAIVLVQDDVLPAVKVRLEASVGRGNVNITYKSDSLLKSNTACIRRFMKDGKIRAEILYNSSNYCHKRFLLCKELAHLAYDDLDTFAIDPSMTDEELHTRFVEQLQYMRHRSIEEEIEQIENLTSSVTSEAAAWVLAFEMLCPARCRQELENDRRSRDDGWIANRFKIPEAFVRAWYRSKLARLSHEYSRMSAYTP